MPVKPDQVPIALQVTYGEIIGLTDTFCQDHLNQEYADLCRKLTATLCRKRPSPLQGCRVKTWAAGIVYCIARNNFAFDKTQTPHITSEDVSRAFRLGKGTIGDKATEIQRILRMHPMEPDWTLPSQMDSNPMAWMISVNGLILDARYLPRAIQEEAYRKKLIPYIPGEKNAEDC